MSKESATEMGCILGGELDTSEGVFLVLNRIMFEGHKCSCTYNSEGARMQTTNGMKPPKLFVLSSRAHKQLFPKYSASHRLQAIEDCQKYPESVFTT